MSKRRKSARVHAAARSNATARLFAAARSTSPAFFSAALFAIAAAAGCKPSPSILEGAEEVAFVALLELDDTGALTAASALVPYDPNGTTIYASTAATTVLAGWTRAALEAARAPLEDPTALASARLEPALGCAPSLPRADYARALDDGGAASPFDPAALPALTAAWTREACEDLAPEGLAFELDCSAFYCPARIAKSERCRFDVTLDCGVGTLDLRMSAGGTFCVEPGRSNPTCAAAHDAEPPAVDELRCSAPACTIEVHRDPPSPIFDVASTLLLDGVAPYIPPEGLTGTTGQMPKQGRYLGYAYDFAILDRAIAVALGPGAPIEFCNDTAFEGTLAFYDPDTLQRTRTATAPPCLTLLESFRGDDRFYGIYAERDQTLAIGTFDAATATLRTRSALAGSDLRCDRPIALFENGAILTAVVDGTNAAAICGARGSFIYTFDRETLAPIDRHQYVDASAYAADRVDEETIVLGESFMMRAMFVDVRTGTVTRTVIIPRDIARNDVIITDVATLPRTGRVLLGLGRNLPTLQVIEPSRGIEASAIFFEVDAHSTGALPWPRDQGKMLVAGVSRNTAGRSWEVNAAWFDIARAKMEAGATPIGHGAVRRLRADANDRVFVLLPWEPRLARIAPR